MNNKKYIHGEFSLFVAVTFYKATIHTELANAEPHT